jgi:hypothetical protein
MHAFAVPSSKFLSITLACVLARLWLFQSESCSFRLRSAQRRHIGIRYKMRPVVVHIFYRPLLTEALLLECGSSNDGAFRVFEP